VHHKAIGTTNSNNLITKLKGHQTSNKSVTKN